MARRDHTFALDEYYHCYNRGSDKRTIFHDADDYSYFIDSLIAYNSEVTLGKLRLHKTVVGGSKIVDLLTYSLLPNHFHLVLKEKTTGGISKYIRRVCLGYAMYYNQKYQHSGSLFQGTYKSKWIASDQNVRQVIGYVYFNNLVHNINDQNLFRSYIDHNHPLVRVLNSNKLKEIVQIIKEQRLSFDD